ncbi:MAG: Rho termination factor N-terminal domain-containing protein [Thermoleophilaceae bacterium]
MSVLQRKELEDSPLADLHAIASELGIDGYRGLRKADLVAAILDLQGGDGAGADDATEEKPALEKRGRAKRARAKPARDEPVREVEDKAAAEEPEGEVADEPEREEEAPAAAEAEPEETAAGVLDVLPNGSGFMRREDGPDCYVSQAQIRRCELRPGDEVAGPVRGARRNERHPSLVRVTQVNGRDAEPPEERPEFAALTAVHASERLPAPSVLEQVPFGKGSRVAVAGPPGAGATRVLREVVTTLAGAPGDLSVSVVLAAARPEEVTEWRRDTDVPVYGGSVDSTPDELGQAGTLAVERAKRVVERGGDAVVLIDSLDAFEPAVARRLFGAGRNVEQAGSLTVVAAVGEGWEHLRLASTRVVLEPGAGEPKVAAERSGTQRADLLS